MLLNFCIAQTMMIMLLNCFLLPTTEANCVEVPPCSPFVRRLKYARGGPKKAFYDFSSFPSYIHTMRFIAFRGHRVSYSNLIGRGHRPAALLRFHVDVGPCGFCTSLLASPSARQFLMRTERAPSAAAVLDDVVACVILEEFDQSAVRTRKIEFRLLRAKH